MKTIVLLITGALMTLSTVSAETKNTARTQGEDFNETRYSYVQPIQFVERGVEFLIFPDGSFDFNTNLDQTPGSFYYRERSIRRGPSLNMTWGAPHNFAHYFNPRGPRGVIITHDSQGRVRRIGNVFVNYNRYDQIRRVGSVYIRYNRFGLVNQVGGLRIRYNRFGEVISMTGEVNFWNPGYGQFTGHGSGNTPFDFNTTWSHDFHINDNDSFYYYKKDGEIKTQKKLKSAKKE